MEEKIKEIINKTFELKEKASDYSQDVIHQWDSFGHIKLIMNIEKEFNIKIETKEIVNLINLKKIKDYLNGKR